MAETSFDPRESASRLLNSIGGAPVESVTALPGGRNNRVWKVAAEGGLFLLKHYYWSPEDPRDRLGQEWDFLTFLQDAGIETAPAPMAKDGSLRAALFEFIDGCPIPPGAVTAEDIRAAIFFFEKMNSHRHLGGHLRPVSEGCFSLSEHLTSTAKRVDRLAAISLHLYPEVDVFVQQELQPVWEVVRDRLVSAKAFNVPLSGDERCLSPSDFGFHNSLRQKDGRVRFIDFEYAGWDDPAKTVADFCNQPDGILPDHLAQHFRDAVDRAFPGLDRRMHLLEPLYQIKWACICLNPFGPGGRFDPNRPDRSPEVQLGRARAMAQRARKAIG